MENARIYTRQVKNEKIVFVNNMWMCKIISNAKINMKFLFVMVLKEFQKALILSFLTNSQLLRIPEIALFREFNYLSNIRYVPIYQSLFMTLVLWYLVFWEWLWSCFFISVGYISTEMFKNWFWKLKILCLVHLVTATSVVLIWKKN